MISQNLTLKQKIHGFTISRIEQIPELRSEAAIFIHDTTGARCIHLFNDDPNNLFAIAFRTPVSNHTGVPHILEHSVLCGSRKFPLKDPFLELLKGSLQTFLNAFTYPDKTVYPVSSQVPVDFYNLVDVYCDAVFFPLLTKTAFLQEGWHFAASDTKSAIDIKGIVYNEMKGVFSDFSSHTTRKTLASLYPDTSYAFESGGDPDHITDLTYEEFVAFHHRYYHPSNSYIFLYGNNPSSTTLDFLNKNYLDQFTALIIDSTVKKQPLWNAPRRMSIEAPASKEDDGTATVALCWVFGDTTDAVSTLLGTIFARYLLDTESSPLRRALIDSGLGEDLDNLCGFDADLVQSLFAVGLRKTKPEHAEAIRNLVLKTIEHEVSAGINEQLLEGAIRQIEFRLREITNGYLPYNIRLAERCFRSWLYNGDPLAHLAFEKALAFIKQEKRKGLAFFTSELTKRFLDNSHNLLGVISASSSYAAQLEQRTQLQVKRLTDNFSEKQKEEIVSVTARVTEEQSRLPSPEVIASLPRLHLSDLPKRNQTVPCTETIIEGVRSFLHPVFTSGIVYYDIGFDLRAVSQELVPYIPLYCDLLTKCGAAGCSFTEMSTRISLAMGGLSSSLMCEETLHTPAQSLFICFFHGKALASSAGEMAKIFADLFSTPDLANEKQILDSIREMRNSIQASVIQNGNSFAVLHAGARIQKTQFIAEQLEGVSQLRFLDALIKQNNCAGIVDSLGKIHKALMTQHNCILSITNDNPEEQRHNIETVCAALPHFKTSVCSLEFSAKASSPLFGIETGASVNFAAKVWKLAAPKPEDIGALFLLSRNLSTGYLWNKIRVEGGAYGARAAYASGQSVFSCSSYRDPKLLPTLEHFEQGLKNVTAGLPADEVEQSIVGSIGRLDMPKSAHEKGFAETCARLTGRTEEFRQQVREAILTATPEVLSKQAKKILASSQTAVTILGGASGFDELQKSGVKIKREGLILS